MIKILLIIFIATLSLEAKGAKDIDNIKNDLMMECVDFDNKAKCREWFKFEKNQYEKKKSDEGCFYMGYIYMGGHGVNSNTSNALSLFEPLCIGKFNSNACYNIGVIYDFQSNYSAAKKYYQNACNWGNTLACENLKKPIYNLYNY